MPDNNSNNDQMKSKGLVISGEFGKIILRQRSEENIELGELLVADTANGKIILQAYDLFYGSQISQQNLELVSGLKLEYSDNQELEFMDPKLRNYTLAALKPMIATDHTSAKLCKLLPDFFSSVREITKDDLKFLTAEKVKYPLYVGKLRSGSKMLDVDIVLPGEKVFSHHILITATTGRGKSLDENEEVLIEQNNKFSIKSIGEIVNNSQNFQGSRVLSMNPKNYLMNFKKITNFVRHKAPKFMYKVLTESGREIMVTKDHNLHVLKDGKLSLLKTQEIKTFHYLPLPLQIDESGDQKDINLFELLGDYKEIFALNSKIIISNLKSKEECIKILSLQFKKPVAKYDDFINKKNRINLQILKQLLKKQFSTEELNHIKLTDLHKSTIIPAIYPLSKEFLQLLGYYIAEGYCLNDTSFRISCSDKEGRILLNNIFKKLDLNYFWIRKKDKNTDVGIASSIFTKILKELGLGNVSGNKRFPRFFMNLSNQNLRILLKTYFEGDGGVDRETTKVSRRFKISATSKSKKLASDICLALYRFGLLARCKKTFKRATNTGHKGHDYYRVSLSGKNNLTSFLSKIGFQFARKNTILKDRFNYKENTNVDIIPINCEQFRQSREKTGLSQKQFSRKIECSQQIISLIEKGKRRPSRDLFSRIVKKFKEFKDVAMFLNFRWDKIKDIKKIKYNKKYVYDLTVEDNKTFLAGHGGLFVHNSNLTSVMLWNQVDKDYCGILVLDPHDEYYGRAGIGLKDHPQKQNVAYYTPKNPPPGAKTLVVNIRDIKPGHFYGTVEWSDPQIEGMTAYYREYGVNWIEAIIQERPLSSNVRFNEATIAVLRRRLLSMLDLEYANTKLYCNGVFDLIAGQTTIKDICNELEQAKTVIIDTSSFGGSVEILIGSLVASEIFSRYKHYKINGLIDSKPVISVILEEAPRVLGKEVLERGSNIFGTIAREGRKFKVGLTAITQLPSLIPREILANMNTKIILGIEMAPERQAIIDSASQDLSTDNRNIAALDKGEAIITSNFTKFATPIKIPLFEEIVKKTKEENNANNANVRREFGGVNLS